jgi:hypothetical protein
MADKKKYDIDMSEYMFDGKNDEEKIKDGYAVPCRICADAFSRIRLTWRYCATCHKGFCEGEHGNFARGGRGCCVICGSTK